MDGEDEAISLDILKPGMKIGVIANCMVVQCDSEDDAIILAEALKVMDGGVVIVKPKEQGNG